MGKKGDISIGVIAAILISLLGIILYIAISAGTLSSAQAAYCRSFYSIQKQLTGHLDQDCEKLTKMEVNPRGYEDLIITRFNELMESEVLLFAAGAEKNLSIPVPGNSQVRNSALTVSLLEQSITAFADRNLSKKMIFPPGGTTYTASINKPQGAYITGAHLEISGQKFPSKADMVILIDTSVSMANEWTTLCSSLPGILTELRSMGIDVRTKIYGLSLGSTYGSCKEADLLEEDMLNYAAENGIAMHPMQFSFAGGNSFSTPPYDLSTEAWGLGVAWLAKNYPWRYEPDVKRIIVPISDSDPTGGGQLTCTNKEIRGQVVCVPEGKSAFSGNEEAVIRLAILEATENPEKAIYIMPVYGDTDALAPEGYDLGVPDDECSDYASTCLPLMAMMQELAAGTGGPLVGYKNHTALRDAMLNIIITPYPNDITVAVNGMPVWHHAGELNMTEEPTAIMGEIVEGAFNTCTGLCPITVKALDGTVLLDRLRLRYYQNMSYEWSIGSSGPQSLELNYIKGKEAQQVLDITKQLNASLSQCRTDQCKAMLNLASSSEGGLSLRLSANYLTYPLKEQILSAILRCWERSGWGRSQAPIACSELIIPAGYVFHEPITEEGITALIQKENLCQALPNSDFNCGAKDALSFTKDINTVGAVLVEYRNRKIQVS